MKEKIIKKIKNHLKIHNKIMGFSVNPKNEKYIKWINEYFENNIELANSPITEKLWVLMHNDEIYHCPLCGKKPNFRSFNIGYSKHCKECGRLLGSEHAAKLKNDRSPEIIVTKKCKECGKEFSYKTRKLNNTIKYYFCSKSCSGTYNFKHYTPEQRKIALEKTNKTNKERYGDDWVVNSQYSRNKTKEKLGVEYPFQDKKILKKTQESHLKNTGYNYPFENPETISKIRETKIERYGDLLNPMSRYKDYEMPSGKIIKIQGNEAQALDSLLKLYEEKDIIVGRKNIENEIGKITYIKKDNSIHTYYPDIYVKPINKVFEVKSTFTYNIHKETNQLKKEAILNKNIDFEFMIID